MTHTKVFPQWGHLFLKVGTMQFSLPLKTKLLFSVLDTFPLNFKTHKVEKPDISITLFPKKHPTATPSHPEHSTCNVGSQMYILPSKYNSNEY